MSVLPEHAAEIAKFPLVLRELIEAELAAGNEVAKIASCFPAPPAGAYVKLTKPVTTRLRASGGGVDFYDRNSSIYSGEFTDAKRFYFVLEPPHPQELEPDMDKIRAERQELYARTMSVRLQEDPPDAARSSIAKPENEELVEPPTASSRTQDKAASGTVERFVESMVIDYEKWHDGIGYDLELIRSATAEEREEIERVLLARGTMDWRDVEALAVLDSAKARDALARTKRAGDFKLRFAVLSNAPQLMTETETTGLLVEALTKAEFDSGLTQAMHLVEGHHPQAVIEALFHGLLERDGTVAVHFSGLLMRLHGKTDESFDWGHRPLFLKFNTNDRAVREAAFRELCERIEVPVERWLPRS